MTGGSPHPTAVFDIIGIVCAVLFVVSLPLALTTQLNVHDLSSCFVPLVSTLLFVVSAACFAIHRFYRPR